MNLRTKIESLMREGGLTKAMLSRETGLPYTTIDSILKRDTFEKVKLSTLQTLKEYFNVSLDYLMIDSVEDKNYGKPQIAVTYREQQIILAYRNNPTMQSAVDKILGIEADIAEGVAPPVPFAGDRWWGDGMTYEQYMAAAAKRWDDRKNAGASFSTSANAGS